MYILTNYLLLIALPLLKIDQFLRFLSHNYFLVIILTLAIGLMAQGWVKAALSRYRKKISESGLTGAGAAQKMLEYYNISIPVQMGQEGQDYFDPRTNSITLSPSSYQGNSITSIAVACHECGHACQYAEGYTAMKVRTALVPVVNVCSNAWIFVFIVGLIMQIVGLTWLAIILYASTVLFALVTLPVEYNASNRAIEYMGYMGVSHKEIEGSKRVLRACAFTYVAAMLVSLLQLLYLLGMQERR